MPHECQLITFINHNTKGKYVAIKSYIIPWTEDRDGNHELCHLPSLGSISPHVNMKGLVSVVSWLPRLEHSKSLTSDLSMLFSSCISDPLHEYIWLEANFFKLMISGKKSKELGQSPNNRTVRERKWESKGEKWLSQYYCQCSVGQQ